MPCSWGPIKSQINAVRHLKCVMNGNCYGNTESIFSAMQSRTPTSQPMMIGGTFSFATRESFGMKEYALVGR